MLKVINLRLPIIGVQYLRVDRGSDFGNPFIMDGFSERERNRVCDLFERYAEWRLTVEPKWLAPIRGHNLACWCAPKRCHAETLLRLANEPE
jgi:hypothetical protein